MKKIIFILILIAVLFVVNKIKAQSFSQTEVKFSLVDNSGNPDNSETGSTIRFVISPWDPLVNYLSGLTVTQTGTQGNYFVSGFTTYQKVKLYIYNGTNWINQTWWGGNDGNMVGDPATVFMNVTDNYTVAGSWHLTNSNFYLDNAHTWIYYPYINPSSTWISSGPPYDDALIWRGWANATYMPLWNSTNYTSYFSTTYFNFIGGKIGLASISHDSISAQQLTIHKDSTNILADPIHKYWNIYRQTYQGADSSDLNVDYYRDDLGGPIKEKTFKLLNNIYILYEAKNPNTDIGTSYTSYSYILPSAALWKIDIDYTFEFVAGTNNGGTDVQDSITLRTLSYLSSGSIGYIYNTHKAVYPNTIYSGYQSTGHFTAQLDNTSVGYSTSVDILCSQNATTGVTWIKRALKYLKVTAMIVN